MYIDILQVYRKISIYNSLFYWLVERLRSISRLNVLQRKCFFVVNKFIPWAHRCRAPRCPAAASPKARGDRPRPPRRRTPRPWWTGRRCWEPPPA